MTKYITSKCITCHATNFSNIKNDFSFMEWPQILDSYWRSIITNWKDSIVTPLHKRGEKELVSNYRPISLTCIACKVMDSIIKDEIISFIINSNLQIFNMLLFQENLANQIYYPCLTSWYCAQPWNRFCFFWLRTSWKAHKLEKYGIRGQLLL